MDKVPCIDMVATGRNIASLREKAGVSVRSIQESLGFNTPQAIYKWQNGQALPTVDNLVALSSILGVSIDEIIVLRGSNG